MSARSATNQFVEAGTTAGSFDWSRFLAFIRFSESKMKTTSVSAAVLNGFVAPTPRRSVANATETKRRMDLAVMSVTWIERR